MRRQRDGRSMTLWRWLGFTGLMLLLVCAASASASNESCFALTDDGPALCPTDEEKAVAIIQQVSLPAQEIEEIEYEDWDKADQVNTPTIYAWVDDYSPLYRHPAEPAAGLPPVRVSLPGFTYVSLVGETWYGDEHWYLVNEDSPRNEERADEYIHEDYVHLVKPSIFPGRFLTSQPDMPFAWVLRMVRPSASAGGPANTDLAYLYRYTVVNIHAAEQVDDRTWYQIGPDQWLRHDYLGIVNVNPRPPGVAPGERWIEIDLYEQTLAAYEGDRMVYATLVSSGLPAWETREGLFRIYHKVFEAKMSGQDGKPDYYYLEDVPWTMYFDVEIGLHAAYWHDSFGYRHSHGCVNLPPISAEWLYSWTTPVATEGVNRVTGAGTWVWVH